MSTLLQTSNMGAIILIALWILGSWFILKLCDFLRYALYLVLTGQNLKEVKNFSDKY